MGGLQTGMNVLRKRSIAPTANQTLGRPVRSSHYIDWATSASTDGITAVGSKTIVSDKMRTLYKCPAFYEKLHDYQLLKYSTTYTQLNTQPHPVQFLLNVPPRVTSHNSTFCPNSVFVWIWEQTAIISLYSINWPVFTAEMESVYCAVWTGSLYTTSLTFSNSTFCPHTVFMCFVSIWEETAIISLYNINWLVFTAEMESVYCAVRNEILNIRISGQLLSSKLHTAGQYTVHCAQCTVHSAHVHL
jgi:hypothetical protein